MKLTVSLFLHKARSMVETLYFRDNKRSIDYILVYRDDEDAESKQRRKTYEQNLVNEGLELEKEDKSVSSWMYSGRKN